MSRKRGNDTGHLRREEVEALEEQESESAGIFSRASTDVLRGRRIVKARRRSNVSAPSASVTGPPSDGPAASEASKKTSQESFGTSPGVNQPNSNPFKGFTGLTDSLKGPKSDITPGAASMFGSRSAAAATLESKNEMQKGLHLAQRSVDTTSPMGNASKDRNGHRSKSTYSEEIKELNTSFHNWVNKQIQRNPLSLWTEGLQDYLKHVEQIEQEFLTSAHAKKAQRTCMGVSSPLSDNSKGISTAAHQETKSASETAVFSNSSNLFSFGKATNSQSIVVENPGASKTAFQGFNFASTSNATPTVPRYGATSNAAEDAEEAMPPEEPTVVIKADNEDENTCYENPKVKLMYFNQEEKEWKDKGVHGMKILVHKTNGTARLLMRDATGKILLNTALYKGLKVEETGKNGLLMNLADDSGTKLIRYLLKTKPAERGAFRAAIMDSTPK